ncbi:MAG: hypothetical protein A3B38_00290 [Candidatus Levybacteria bacterium RIFCSPLOWO2_01_FULL_36_13]|nr:MAG: hypothetical protein A3B38_00290 [Candidatus Levybacteria bacterium RIFCSPLOWO2_01_FULL_36_13]
MTIEKRANIWGVTIPIPLNAKPGEQADLVGYNPRRMEVLDKDSLNLTVFQKIPVYEPYRFKQVEDGHYAPTHLEVVGYRFEFFSSGSVKEAEINRKNIETKRNWWGKKIIYRWKP